MMAATSTTFTEALDFAKEQLSVNFDLKVQQVSILKEVFDRNDCLGILPTGYGKSVIFQLVPWLLQRKYMTPDPFICIIVSPLNSLMEDQVMSLVERGVKACFLNVEGHSGNSYELSCINPGVADDEDQNDSEGESRVFLPRTVNFAALSSREFPLIYAHPETLMTNKIWGMLNSNTYAKRVGCIAVDEVHMIAEWGETFRPKFKEIGSIISVLPDATKLALTATATEDAISVIKKDLYMRSHAAVIRINPDRPNIYLDIKERLPNIRKYEKYDALIEPLCNELSEKREHFPITIVYVDGLEIIGYAYKYLETKMGDSQYNGKESIPENRIFAMYHSKYTNKMKELVVKELRKRAPLIRLVFATVALGMGLNAPSITRVVHFRPPTSVQQFFQGIGRAGRSGQKAFSTLHYNKSDIAKNREGMTDAMRAYCLSDTCLRLTLVKYFGFHDVMFKGPPDECCCVCKRSLGQSVGQ